MTKVSQRYKDLYDKRLTVRQHDGCLSQEDAEWQAMNDTVLQFLEDTGYDQRDMAVNKFIKTMEMLKWKWNKLK